MKVILIVCFLLLSPAYVFAHGTHENPYLDFGIEIEKEQAKEFSSAILNALVEKEKIGENWQSGKVEKIEKKEAGETSEWIVTHYNKEEPDKSKKRLYIFLSLYGEYRGANHTGK